jgi:hypothetical protein
MVVVSTTKTSEELRNLFRSYILTTFLYNSILITYQGDHLKWDDAYWGIDDKYTNGGKEDPYDPKYPEKPNKSPKYSKGESVKDSKATKGGKEHYYGGQTSSTGSSYYGDKGGSSTSSYHGDSGSYYTQRTGRSGGGGNYYGDGSGGGGGGDYYGHGGGGGGGGNKPNDPYADDNCKFSNSRTDCWVNNNRI